MIKYDKIRKQGKGGDNFNMVVELETIILPVVPYSMETVGLPLLKVPLKEPVVAEAEEHLEPAALDERDHFAQVLKAANGTR